MRAAMNMIWLHVEACNLKPAGWVWSPCRQERIEKSYLASWLRRHTSFSLCEYVFTCTCTHAREVFANHLLRRRHTSTHYSGLPFPKAIYLLSLFSDSLGCGPCRLSYLLDALWSPHQSPLGSRGSRKTSRSSSPVSDIDCSCVFLPGHLQSLYPEASWSHLVSLHTE